MADKPSSDTAINPVRAHNIDAKQATEPMSSVTPILTAQDLSQIATALRAGEMTPEQAKTQLIEHTIRTHFGSVTDHETLSLIRSEVEALLTEDPTLAALLRP